MTGLMNNGTRFLVPKAPKVYSHISVPGETPIPHKNFRNTPSLTSVCMCLYNADALTVMAP